MTNGEAYMPVSYDTMFIWLCSTSKYNYLTYNIDLYTREQKEKRKRYNELEKIEGRKKNTYYNTRGKRRKER